MKKRFLIVLLVTGSIDLLLMACCPGPYFGYLQIDNITLQNSNLSAPVTPSETVPFVDFSLGFQFQSSTIASANFNSVFLPTAYAMQPCPRDGELGLKTPIEKVVISANVAVFGIPAGHPINVDEHINVHSSFKVENGKKKARTINEWIDELNAAYFFLPNEKWYFLFQQVLPLSEPIKFEIELLFKDGSRLKAETAVVLIG